MTNIIPNHSKDINVIYKYNTHQRELTVQKATSLKELRENIEADISFPLSKMKLMYNGSNILLNNENYKIYDFFGDAKAITLVCQPKEFSEQSYIDSFEKAFIGQEFDSDKERGIKNITNTITTNNNIIIIPTNNTIPNNPKYLKKLVDDTVYNPKVLSRPVCNKDLLNEATYICSRCRLYWCKHCLKFEVHKSDLIELEFLNTFLNIKRTEYTKDIDEAVINDVFYPNLQKVEFILNEKISVIEKQFKDMSDLLTKIKESQMKMLIESFYQSVDIKQFKTIPSDVQYFKSKVLEVNTNYNKENIEENLNNNEVLLKFRDIIKSNYSDFKFKYKNYFNFFEQYKNFNSTFISQIEAKFKQSNNLRLLSNGDDVGVGDKINNSNNINNSDNKKPNMNSTILKMKYYNTILKWDHIQNKTERIKDFKDRFAFKSNYQVYSGNIFLNCNSRLFIITGVNFNLCYFYDSPTNEIYRLSSLTENHCRGGLVYVDKLHSLICISGKYSSKSERLDIKDMKDMKDMKDGKDVSTKEWTDFPSLNYQRHYAAFYEHDTYLYAFFGHNSNRGAIDIIERINTSNATNWEIVSYTNTKYLDLKLSSHGVVYANNDEVFILGGCVNDSYSDRIFKYNLVSKGMYLSEMVIPGIENNEYFRFWEESGFKQLSSNGAMVQDDDNTYAMFDARDKLHIFNSRTFKYTFI